MRDDESKSQRATDFKGSRALPFIGNNTQQPHLPGVEPLKWGVKKSWRKQMQMTKKLPSKQLEGLEGGGGVLNNQT